MHTAIPRVCVVADLGRLCWQFKDKLPCRKTQLKPGIVKWISSQCNSHTQKQKQQNKIVTIILLLLDLDSTFLFLFSHTDVFVLFFTLFTWETCAAFHLKCPSVFHYKAIPAIHTSLLILNGVPYASRIL